MNNLFNGRLRRSGSSIAGSLVSCIRSDIIVDIIVCLTRISDLPRIVRFKLFRSVHGTTSKLTMNTFQTGETSAVGGAIKPVTDAASSPKYEWAVRIHKPAMDGRPQETVVKDLSREEDVREILDWLDSDGWIVLKSVGDVELEWNVSRDKVSLVQLFHSEKGRNRLMRVLDQYVNRIITAACLVVNEGLTKIALPIPTNENAPLVDGMMRLQCIFFAGDCNSMWNLVFARKDAGKVGDNLETVNLYGKDVYVSFTLDLAPSFRVLITG